ncbi:MAG: YqeG family HAD IIIA-type phosphatase [Acholeplasmataceae bacterium]|nr:YqeG family HAD IIIA-type phosphatase [Acholeplasmataceae bacterium]
MSVYQKCIPHEYHASIFEIPYKTLKEQGINSLFFDLDNTIIGYDEISLSKDHVKLLNDLGKDFNVVIISNTSFKRVSLALKDLKVPFIWHAKKPLKCGFKKALKLAKVNKEEVMMIGDQLMTDIFGATRYGIKGILVKSVKRKSDRKITQFNRKLEAIVLKKIEKNLPELYEERLKQYVQDH